MLKPQERDAQLQLLTEKVRRKLSKFMMRGLNNCGRILLTVRTVTSA